ncbi:Na+/H+ antiporter [Rhodococcus marinonascens]|uniref:Na+/H+ antiporter n=1 Tax=Rhodococcus marinonascens TaxID=38311 RepID=UPI00093322D2|nr:Na+/H+ antiporter [Rhodococcus marinonascens]
MNGVLVLLVIIAAIAVTSLAKRRDLQAPLVLVAIGSAASFIPALPRLELHPEVILGVVLPPLLYSAALKFSVATFRRHLAPILRLGVFTVLVTAVAVAFFSNWLVPEFTLGAALVLGAVVAPTDAVSAVAVGRRLGLPNRVLAILTGEGLVNDATALTLFAVAVSAVVGTRMPVGSAAFFFYEVVGGVLIGLVLATIVGWVRRRMYDSPLETVLGLMLPFAAYLAAEEVSASGVLSVVAAGFLMGHRATDASVPTRIQERSLWESVDLLLEMFVFAYMGLQLRFVIQDVRDVGLPVNHIFFYGFAVLAVVMGVRPVWVLLHWFRRRYGLVIKKSGKSGRSAELGWRESLVVSWAGMRGVVTLAAASGVPVAVASGEPFPGREVIQAVAFVVAVGTLLIQGATMPFLIRSLDLADPLERQREQMQVKLARRISRDAGERELAKFAEHPPEGIERDDAAYILTRVQRSMWARLQAEEAGDAAERRRMGAMFDHYRQAVLRAQREALIAARDAGGLDDEVMRSVLEGLDLEEAAAEERVQRHRE